MTAVALPLSAWNAGAQVWLRGGLTLRFRLVLLLACLGIAFARPIAYTLSSMSAMADPTGPTAFMPIVPVAAGCVAVSRWRGRSNEPEAAPQRAADYLLGVLLLAVGVLVEREGPRIVGVETLTWRGDLAGLAPVAAGLVTLLFGTRMLYRQRAALLLLTASSPVYYRPLVTLLRSATDSATEHALPLVAMPLRAFMRVRPGAGGTYLDVAHRGGWLTVQVTQACAGDGAVLAGALVAVTVALMTRGTRARRTAWALSVVGLCWLGNLMRLVILVMAAHWGGTARMMTDVHPWLGAAIVAVTLRLSLEATGLFGLRFGRPVDQHPRPTSALAVPGPRLVALVMVAAALLAVPMSAATASYNFLAGRSAQPQPFLGTSVGQLPGAVNLAPVSWAPLFFGAGARWDRWLVFPADRAGSDAAPVAVDVVRAAESAGFDTYGLAACYGFHHYRVLSDATERLPGGRLAEKVTFATEGRFFSVISWRQVLVGGGVQRIVVSQQSPVAGPAVAEALHALAVELTQGT